MHVAHFRDMINETQLNKQRPIDLFKLPKTSPHHVEVQGKHVYPLPHWHGIKTGISLLGKAALRMICLQIPNFPNYNGSYQTASSVCQSIYYIVMVMSNYSNLTEKNVQSIYCNIKIFHKAEFY